MGIFDLDSWNEIWLTISRNRKRSIMTAFGVFWGVFMLAVLLGFGMGLGKSLERNLGDMSSNSCFLFSDRTSIPYKGMPAGRWWQLDLNDVQNILKIKGIKYAAPVFWGRSIKASHQGIKLDCNISGTHPDFFKINPQNVTKGRYINELDMIEKRKVCVIGTQIESTLFPGENPIGKEILANSSYYTVVGVASKKSSGINMGSDPQTTVTIPSSLYQQLYHMGNKIHSMAITAHNEYSIKDIENESKQHILANHGISPEDNKAVSSFNLGEMFEKTSALFGGIGLLTWVVGMGTLLAGAIGVSNIMLVVVRERTQEIGVRRALGAKPSIIITQILSESFILTFIAGILGLTSAVAILSILESTLGVSMSSGSGIPFKFQISFEMGLICTFIIILCSLMAGIIPASRALKIKPVEALREE